MKNSLRLALAVATALIPGTLLAGALLEPIKAPDWKIHAWLGGNQGSISDHKGKVILIDFFQVWCPGCNSFSIPLFNYWTEKYADRDDVLVVSIHTVFEGHDVQTADRLRQFIQEKGIRHPVGIDDHTKADDLVPETMKRFKTGGTPHVVIIDQHGFIRFSHFGSFDWEPVEAFIDRILTEKPDTNTTQSSTPSRPKSKSSTSRGTSRRDSGRSASSKPSRGDPSKQDDDRSSGLKYTGRYKMSLEQGAKSCGDLLPPQTVIVQVSIKGDRVDARFTRPFLGLKSIQADFDEESGQFEVQATERTEERGTGIELELDLSGRFQMQAGVPTFEYDFSLEKQGDAEGFECSIRGAGRGTRTGN